MSSRNTFVTTFMYRAETVDIVKAVLDELEVKDYVMVSPHIIAGVLKTAGGHPCDMLQKLLERIDAKLNLLDAPERFDIVVACDDQDDILSRQVPFGLGLYSPE